MTVQEMFDLVYNGDYERSGDYLFCSANGARLYAPLPSHPALVYIDERRLVCMEASMWGPLTIDGDRIYWPGGEFYVINGRLARRIEAVRAAKK
jgi:hypothetical protein